MKNIRQDILTLNNKLKKHSEEYYNNNQSSISDSEYDALYSKYKALIKAHPKHEPNDSILQVVGSGKVDNRFKKVAHQFPMLSLSNAFDEDDVMKFNQKILDQLNMSNTHLKYVVEPKIDGLSISLIYKNGKLVQGITRGDGKTGENVTHNILKIKDIPHQIPYKKDIEFRGEIYMSKQTFATLNKSNNFANARNAASGTLRQLDSKVAEKRNLQSFIYSIPNPLNHKVKTQSEILKFIKKQGIQTNPLSQTVDNIEGALQQIKIVTESRDNLSYEIDGIVLKIDDINLYEDIGITTKFPKYMTAYKFPAEKVQTKLLDIHPTVGRTGRITYNAKLSPVTIAGTIVSNATLHNADYIINLKINVGDIVVVKKAGDIIPKVESLKIKNNNELWIEAKVCHSCGSSLQRVAGEVDQYCLNLNCDEKQNSSFEHFVSRNALNIEGLSIEIIKSLKEHKLIKNLSDIFSLKEHRSQIIKLSGFGKKSADNILNSIDKSKTSQIHRFIFALGIRHVGLKKATVISKRFGSLEKLIDASRHDSEGSIWNIRDIGPKVKGSILDYFANEHNINEIKKMQANGLKLVNLAAPKSKIFEGKTFVITGTLSSSRDYFKKIIEENSGDVSNYVSAKTDYLLAGDNAGSKKSKAEQLGIKIINEFKFKDIIKGENHG